MADTGPISLSITPLVSTPGYHIHPQWDLRHTRHIIQERAKRKKSFSLSLAPMVDMFSILVIYLLMNFSSSGEAYFISHDIVIPKAHKGQPMKSFPLISVTGGKVIFDAENVEGQTGVTVTEENDQKVPQLRSLLHRIKAIEEAIGGVGSFHGQINIQADQMTPVEDVKRVMRVLVEENWTGINFIVEPETKR